MQRFPFLFLEKFSTKNKEFTRFKRNSSIYFTIYAQNEIQIPEHVVRSIKHWEDSTF